MYTEIPNVPGTPETRIAALKESRELLKQEPKVAAPAIFGGGTTTTEPGPVAGSTELINLATYIETGHSYFDTHPVGKRRPIIKNTTVTVVAPNGAPSQEDIDHLLSHIENGDFEDVMESLIKEAKEARHEAESTKDAPDEEKPNPWAPKND